MADPKNEVREREVIMQDEYKYPQRSICHKCNWFVGNCTKYPKEDWVDIWLTNQCDGFECKQVALCKN